MPNSSLSAEPTPGEGLSRLALLGIGLAPLPLLFGWTIYASGAGLGTDAIRLPTLAVIAWGVVFGFLSWRKLDEGGKEAIKVAFCWGVGPGMMIAAITVLLVLMYPQPVGAAVEGAVERFVNQREPGPGAWSPEVGGFIMGAAAVIGIQQILFVVVWLGWWARRRG